MFAVLDVYHDQIAHSAAMHMAMDEALLEFATLPSIRFYRWHSPALSFGYFGKFADVARYVGKRDLVRRWTGGGIVFHGEDLTYSIVIPSDNPLFDESSIAIYAKIHHALCEAFNANGKRAVVAGDTAPYRIAPRTRAALGASGCNCFENPVCADVMLDGQKIAGAAQRRTRRGLLQQGSVQGVDLGNRLVERFAQALSSNRCRGKIDERIWNRARELAEQRYGTDAWLRKR